MQPGQFLVKGNDKRKIYFVNEFIIGFEGGYLESEIRWMKIESLKKEGWSLLEEPWVPNHNEIVWVVYCYGMIDDRQWNSFTKIEQDFLLKTGNYARTESEAELYKQKLIERMGRKE